MRALLIVILITGTALGQYVARPPSGGASTSAANSWSALQTFSAGGKVTGGTSGGVANATANYLYFEPPAIGAATVMRFSNREASTSDFAMVLNQSAGSLGETRQDNQLSFGYNIGPLGRINSSEHAWWHSMENRFKAAVGVTQLEDYWTYQSAAGSAWRPFGHTINLGTDSIETAMRPDSLIIGYKDTSYDWLAAASTASSGTLTFTRNSAIVYNGTKTDFLSYNGNDILGFSTTGSQTGRLFNSAQSATFFSVSDPSSNTLTINVGGTNARGLRWNSSTGWEFQSGASTWQKMGVPFNHYYNGYVGIGPTSFTPDRTLTVYDATPTTGITIMSVRAGAGQNNDLFQVFANDGSTKYFYVNSGGAAFGKAFVTSGNEVGIQNYYDTAHPISVGTAGSYAFSSTTAWSGTIDADLRRTAASTVKLTDGSTGTGTLIHKLPTSSAGLASGTLYNNGGTPTIVP